MRLVFFGDVHRDAPSHALAKWKEFLSYSKTLKNAWFIGMGDYIDSMSTSEREAMTRASMHESTTSDLENMASSKITLLAKELDFMRGRLIGLVNGNHFFSFPSGINSDQKLCEKLGCKYLGVSSFIRITFEYSGRRETFDLWVHHGAGGARLPGGSINRVDQMREFAEADAFAMGHDHKRGVFPANPKLHLMSGASGLRLKEKQQWLLRTGSFLKAYEDGQISYNVDAARGPASLGHVELEFVYKHSGGKSSNRTELAVRGIA